MDLVNDICEGDNGPLAHEPEKVCHEEYSPVTLEEKSSPRMLHVSHVRPLGNDMYREPPLCIQIQADIYLIRDTGRGA